MLKRARGPAEIESTREMSRDIVHTDDLEANAFAESGRSANVRPFQCSETVFVLAGLLAAAAQCIVQCLIFSAN
jgi:hypothetical protein